ncbi:uncharacterized protein LOC129257971 isoform X1 [Lytechinus pictus]|uniref:uncharacterized protein LOC129257971 isoform X1 n=2 Tax=Lytechinus pictus TaxID=7653 RepID=UPI0030B9EA02
MSKTSQSQDPGRKKVQRGVCAMHHHWFTGVLLIGVFLTLPNSLDGSAICDERRSELRTVSRRVTRTLQVATYYKCWLFWTCTTYRSITGYTAQYQLLMRYFTTNVCCDGYIGDASQNLCLPISGPDESLSTTTESPSLNQTSENGQPDAVPDRNETTLVGSPRTTPLTSSSSNFPFSTTEPSNSTARADGVGMMSSKARRQALIMISLIVFFITVVVFSVVMGCVVYRRRRLRRVQRKVDSLHMEPLRDLQPLSETTSHIQHFSPPSAPNDEYAIPDKASKVTTPPKEASQNYENTCIDGRPLANAKDQAKSEGNRPTQTSMDGFSNVEKKKNKSLFSHLFSMPKASNIQHFSPPSAPNDEYAIPDKASTVTTPPKKASQTYENTCIDEKPLADAKVQAKSEENHLTHTYMDGFVCVETKKDNVPNTKESIPDNNYNEVDEMPSSTANLEECYTEVDNPPSSSVVTDVDIQDHKYYYTKFDTSSPSTTECYAEVYEMQPSSVDVEGAVRDEYETVGDQQLTYDHIDRSSTTGNSEPVNHHKEGCSNAGGKYGVLVQSSSVESQESYDVFQRSVSQTDKSGVDGYEPLLAVPSQGSATEHSVGNEAYDDLDRMMPKTRKKGKNLLEKLRQGTNTTAYGHLVSSFESDTSETNNSVMEPIYSNQDAGLAGDRESTYTDMSGSRPNSLLQRGLSLRSERTELVTYTEMSPTHFSSNYYNVDLENIHESID